MDKIGEIIEEKLDELLGVIEDKLDEKITSKLGQKISEKVHEKLLQMSGHENLSTVGTFQPRTFVIFSIFLLFFCAQ